MSHEHFWFILLRIFHKPYHRPCTILIYHGYTYPESRKEYTPSTHTSTPSLESLYTESTDVFFGRNSFLRSCLRLDQLYPCPKGGPGLRI